MRIITDKLLGESVLPATPETPVLLYKSHFIESILVGIPIHAIFLDGTEDNWDFIDGAKRVRTLRDYLDNKYELRNLQLLKELEKCSFKDIPYYLQRKLKEYEFRVNILITATSEEKEIVRTRIAVYPNS